jgi:hypothetical protein
MVLVFAFDYKVAFPVVGKRKPGGWVEIVVMKTDSQVQKRHAEAEEEANQS